ncbi:hypothetical protein BVRB_9g217830 [Beta vulgaris subsp. vulgaris]|nr:hypothetical protein BVRB_9g217830 [Beta vulgaris subsp. vulgaris]
MFKNPRFCSLIVRDNNGTKNHWKRTCINIDDHFIIHQNTTIVKTDLEIEDGDDKEAAINSFLAEISVSTPLNENKPLWELHVLMDLNCVVLRVHHSLGDGVSLMSLLSSCFCPKNEIISEGRKKGIWKLIKSLWLTIVFILRLLGRILWVKDKVSVVSGGDGVELWPRKLVTAKFMLEDLKSIKLAIPNATINDVLLGIISSGLSKYIDIKSPMALHQTLQLTAIIPVNLRKYPYLQKMSELVTNSNSGLSGWGNKTSIILLPIKCLNGLNALEHVRALKATMDKKKHSYVAYFGFRIVQFLVSYVSPKVGCWCFRKIIRNTTLVISNIKGPSERMVIADNLVTFMKVNVSSIPHAITVHMVSYAGMVNLQVMVAKDIISDPEILVEYFQDSFLKLKNSIKMNNQV